jgi:flavin-dependent dehydrogenase
MAGDAAGMIAPLCGNGMSMAIQAGFLAARSVIRYFETPLSRDQLEADYRQNWEQQFQNRLWVGRQIQRFFGRPYLTRMALTTCRWLPPVGRYLIKKSHGQPLQTEDRLHQ